jgi:hypothetical protein
MGIKLLEGHAKPDHIHMCILQYSDDDRVFERKKSDTDTLGSFENNEMVYEQKFLDPGVLCEYNRTERRTNTGIHQESGRS